MIETFKQLDTQWFLTVNNQWQNGLFDLLCPFMRQQSNWYLLYAVLVYFLFSLFGKKGWWLLLGAVVTVLIADQVSANLIKNTVQRLRPCNDPALKEQVRLLVHCGGGFSFVSAHACNHFAIAVYFSAIFGKGRKWVLPVALSWAAIISYSQIYVGVHYPLDVICGALLGSIIGWITQKVVLRYVVFS